jgi:hypothetical protein
VISAKLFQSKKAASGRHWLAMKKLIIAANLGQVRVLKYREAGEDPIELAHLVEEPLESTKEHVKSIHETVTSQSGRFGRGSPVGFETGMSYAEGNHLKAEIERSALKKIAARIDAVLEKEACPAWTLAAPQSILAKLKEMLANASRGTLASSIGADLTRCPLAEMEERFLQKQRQ